MLGAAEALTAAGRQARIRPSMGRLQRLLDGMEGATPSQLEPLRQTATLGWSVKFTTFKDILPTKNKQPILAPLLLASPTRTPGASPQRLAGICRRMKRMDGIL
jgi:hypothetical protein